MTMNRITHCEGNTIYDNVDVEVQSANQQYHAPVTNHRNPKLPTSNGRMILVLCIAVILSTLLMTSTSIISLVYTFGVHSELDTVDMKINNMQHQSANDETNGIQLIDDGKIQGNFESDDWEIHAWCFTLLYSIRTGL